MATSPIKRVKRPERLYRSVQEAIRNYIVENGLSPGDPMLSESELARQLGVSRNSVREAVKALEINGFLVTRHGAGVFVGDFSFDTLLDNLPYGLMQDLQNVRELLQIRLILELGTIESVIEQISDARLKELDVIVARMEERARRGESFPEEDREFHRLLFTDMGNKLLLKLLDIFWLAYHRAAVSADIQDPDPIKTYQDHAEMLAAVKARDVKRAKEAIETAHYTGLFKRLNASERKIGARSTDTLR